MGRGKQGISMLKILDKIEDLFVTVGLSVMCIALAMQIFARYVLNSPLIWSEEFARYVFVWVVFVGAGYGVRHKAHISMEFFVDHMPKIVQKWLGIALNIVAICMFGCLIPVGFNFTLDQSAIASSAMQIPMSMVVSAVPVGCVIVCIRLIFETISLIGAKETST
jgi:TRAP-type C4-dicarboxylate transport system permease small subunit